MVKVSSSFVTLVGGACLASGAAASPLARRGLIGDLLAEMNQALEGIMSGILHIKPPAAPTSETDALSSLSKIFSGSSTVGFVDSAEALLKAGFAPNLSDLLDVNKTYTTGGNSMDNSPPDLPANATPFFPKAGDGDAPYSVSEEELRKSIFIPDGFTNGVKAPLLIIPGTGQPSFMTYSPNLIPVLQDSEFADPVWLNLPGFLLGDAQRSAEFIAYASHYVAALTGKQVTLIAYSQGNIITQWALTFWPSMRKVISDFVALSPAFRGSILVDAGCLPIKDITGCPPAIHQQRLNSNFVNAMRSHGGDSALVPTTLMFSATDEIAQPQTGDDATALLKDANSVGVTPVRVQDSNVCGGKLAGGVATHEGMLYHPLTLAMLEDAMTHDGPGDLSRVDIDHLCGLAVAEGMSLSALVDTEAGVAKAGAAFVQYRPYLKDEPAIASYAA
ncbi:putative lipase [Mycena latifolia]|nr:putative lipase [Mycena latifolia]